MGQARQVCGDPMSAEDACQDVFARLLIKPQSAESLSRAYLVIAVRNACRDQRRRELKSQPLGPGAPEPATIPPGDGDEEDQSLLLTDWRPSLPRQQRLVVELWNAQHSYPEIAAALDLAVKTVNTHLERAKAKLRVLVRREERGERRRQGVGSGE